MLTYYKIYYTLARRDNLEPAKQEHNMKSEQVAKRLLGGISESLSIDPDRLARVAGRFITPNGNQVNPVRINGRTVYVTVPQD